jgi:glycosyltransferase involved in cell wall biosynthesis
MHDFSIITVCYNSAATVGDTLNSVLKQSGVSFEHIIKDAGSEDETIAIAARINPSAVVEVSKDRGIYDGMNQGFALANGNIVGFLNSDDYYAEPNVLRAVRDTFLSTGCDIVYGDVAMINASGQVVRSWISGEISRISLNGKQLPHPALFVRRSALALLGQPFDPTYRIAADYKQQLLLVEKAGLSAIYLPRTITIMRMGGESTGNFRSIMEGWMECARAYREVHKRSGWPTVTRKVISKIVQVRANSFYRFWRKNN